MPICLFAEHRAETNGKWLPTGNGLLGALSIRGLSHISVGEKDRMRALVMRGPPWTEAEKAEILDYCMEDVIAPAALLPVMAHKIDWPRALLRGRYMAAVGSMEHKGIPVDSELHAKFVAEWGTLKMKIIADVDRDFGVYDGTTFKEGRFDQLTAERGIPWARHESGRLKLDKATFDERANSYPELRAIYELRSTMSSLRLTDIQIGADHRARCMLSPFGTKTGRNAPSATQFIFGPARWIRGLVRAQEGHAVAYLDWSAQEIAIAAGLSGDERLAEAYASGDPYMEFAKSAGLLRSSASADERDAIRNVCKTIVLGVGYGMGPETMALRAGISVIEARELLRIHRTTYHVFWRWLEDTVTTAQFRGYMLSTFGWRWFIGNDDYRSMLNYPMQSNGAEMMRIAAIAGTEAGLEVCCPVHDAFLISAPICRIDDDVAAMQAIMSEAGRAVTGGLDVRTDAKIVRWPDRFMDKRGAAMWARVTRLLGA